MFILGCHLSLSGGYAEMGRTAAKIGANTFQYFTKNPRGGQSKPADPEDVSALRDFMQENKMSFPLAHAPYIYNPATADERIREYTLTSMKSELEFLEALPGSLYNFHPGAHVKQGAEVGCRLTAECLNAILWEGMSTTVLIETMSGKGTEVGATFEEIRSIIDAVDEKLRPSVGVCLDTCHISDGGYSVAADPDAVLTEFDRVIGLERLYAVHLNDSKNPVGSHKDRHEKIGEGELGLDGIRRIITHPALADKPFYLETPNDIDGYAREIALLREMRSE